METRHITQYIDDWLAEAPHVLDNRTVDFALDVRLMVEALANEQDESLASAAAGAASN
jgi:hypothetical protein